MIILGIDPGTGRTGYGYISAEGSKPSFISCGCISTDKNCSRQDRLLQLHRKLLELIGERKPHVIAVESLFFNRNISTALSVGEARGVILLAAAQNGVAVAEYTPLQVKESLTGYGRATKAEVKEMVKLNLELDKIKGPDDVADGLAIALCHSFYSEMEGILI